jgi:D-alanine transaminase
MARISYVNGRYVNHSQAFVHMEDRGYQFSDGVYEVIAFYNGRLLDEDLHMKRLIRSLSELKITPPMTEKSLRLVIRELLTRNHRENGTLYIQISRGVAKRDHAFPKEAAPALVMSVSGPKMPKEKEVRDGIKVITYPDQRWQRRDIKSVSLLANIIAKQAAAAEGAREAWLMDSDLIIEGSSSNSAIVNAKGEIITTPADERILEGITRTVVLDIARKAGIKIVERPFSLKEAKAAKEAFMMSTTANILPVVRIDDATVADGKPGKITLKLLGLYFEHIYRQTGKRWN